MKLACNYSPELMGLIEKGEAPVDFIKAGAYGPFLDELSKMRAMRPVLLHGMGSLERAGMQGYEALDFNRMNALLAEYGSPHLAIHMCITNEDAAPGMTEEQAFRRMAACVSFFMERICVPLLLENTGDTPEERTVYDLIPFVEPERIRRLLDETGAGMLLDITHAKVTAQYRGWDLREYVARLPLERVVEVHLTGSGFDAQGAPVDAHGPLEEEDYGNLGWVLGRTDPRIVTLEYGRPAGSDGPKTDASILRQQLGRIHSIIKGRQ